METRTWWLRGEGGVAARVAPGGLLLGRSPHCDVVLRSERASRRHALVHLDDEGPRLVLLGRGGARVNGAAIEGATELAEGDRIELPELTLEVARGEPEAPADAAIWLIEGPGGALFALRRDAQTIGGAATDDLRVEGWPAGLLELRREGDRLLVRAREPVTVDGDELDGAGSRPLRVGSRVEHGGASIRVATGGQLGEGSTAAAEPDAPTEIRLEFLPRGGRLHVTREGRPHVVYLSDRRCDLVAVLLQPPEPYEAGGLVDDEAILARVWGPKHHADRTHLNVLLHRVRKDLTRAGLDGAALIERAEGGGATRFVLDEGAAVHLG